MQLALMTEPQLGGSYQDLLELARWAESNGLVSFSRSDHIYWDSNPKKEATEAFATLAGLARETSKIRLCVLVTPITYRHPSMIAKTAATIDEMSGGRLDLGVGTGWNDFEHEAFGIDFPDWKARFSRLEEALGYLQAAFGIAEGFVGEHYRLDAEVLPRPVGIRLIVGGDGKVKTPNLAGRFAQEYNHFAADPTEIGEKIGRVNQSADDAGRPHPQASVMGPVLVGRTKVEFRERLQRAAALRGRTPEEHERILRDAHIPAGNAEEVAAKLTEYQRVGVSKWYLQWFDLSDRDGLYASAETLLASGLFD